MNILKKLNLYDRRLIYHYSPVHSLLESHVKWGLHTRLAGLFLEGLWMCSLCFRVKPPVAPRGMFPSPGPQE